MFLSLICAFACSFPISNFNKKPNISHKDDDEYQIEIEKSEHYDQPYQNEFGDPPVIWIIFISFISAGGVAIIIYSIYSFCKKSKEQRIENTTLINYDEDLYHNAIPPTLPQQNNQVIYQQNYPQFYDQSYPQPGMQYQPPYQQPGMQYPQPVANYQQPTQLSNVY